MAKKTQKTILVSGATGKQGGAVFHHLQKHGYSLRVLTRNPDKPEARAFVGKGVDVVQGDLADPTSLARALEDVDGVFSVQDSSVGHDGEVQQGTNLIDAASRAGVSHFVYSSVGSANQKTGIPHFESKAKVEDHLRGKGLAYTIFRPVFFMENWLLFREAIESGTLALPLSPDRHLQMVAVDDIGNFVASAFEKPGHWHGKDMDLAGDDLPIQEIAAALGRSAGREVRYKQVTFEQFKAQAGEEMTIMYKWFEDVGYSVDVVSLREQYPFLTGFDRWLNLHWQSAAQEQKANA